MNSAYLSCDISEAWRVEEALQNCTGIAAVSTVGNSRWTCKIINIHPRISEILRHINILASGLFAQAKPLHGVNTELSSLLTSRDARQFGGKGLLMAHALGFFDL